MFLTWEHWPGLSQVPRPGPAPCRVPGSMKRELESEQKMKEL